MMKPARLQHPLVLRVRLRLEFCVKLPVPLPRRQHFFANVLAVPDGFLDHLVLNLRLLLPQGLPGHEFRVPAQQDVRPAARHVRRDGNGAPVPRLGNDLRFLRVVLRVQHLVRNPRLESMELSSSLISTLIVPTSRGCPVL